MKGRGAVKEQKQKWRENNNEEEAPPKRARGLKPAAYNLWYPGASTLAPRLAAELTTPAYGDVISGMISSQVTF